jgi:small subunit ribosomal protein S18
MNEERDNKLSFKRFHKKKCKFCINKVEYIEYKDVASLRQFTTERGKILSGRITGNCARHQRQLANAIKNARIAALMPFVAN